MQTIVINVNPNALTIDSLKIGWGSIFFVLAVVLALLLFVIEARSHKIQKVHIIVLCVLIPLFGFIFARLFIIIENLVFFHDTGPIAGSSLRAYGLFIGAVAAGQIYARITRIPLWWLSDIGILCLILFMVVYRVGCLLVGCCYGIPCDLCWAIVYTNPNTTAPLGIAIHPTQAYHLTWNTIVFLVVWLTRRRFNTAGLPGLLALILYSLGDFAIRFFRGDEPSLAFLSLSQITGLIIVAVTAPLIIFRIKSTRQKQGIDT